jgi:two-component system chemotaxis response regulator CheY
MKMCLIIDHGAEIKSTAAAYLADRDFAVEQVKNCNQALAKCRTEMPDVILLASDTPNMSGLEFLSRLRRTQRGQKPVVLYCADEHDPDRIGQAIWRGASECLIKPFDADLLAFKLNQSGAV